VLLELYLPHDLVTSGQYGPGDTWSVPFRTHQRSRSRRGLRGCRRG
jgi:hypothetical protein